MPILLKIWKPVLPYIVRLQSISQRPINSKHVSEPFTEAGMPCFPINGFRGIFIKCVENNPIGDGGQIFLKD